MDRCSAILLLGLLLWVEPASAQVAPASKGKKYSLTVSIRQEINPTLTPGEIEQILGKASDILQKCRVKFELKAILPPFTAGSVRITDEPTLEAVHQVRADIKIVQGITFCPAPNASPPFLGCAFRPRDQRHRTMIVSTEMVGALPGRHPNLWAHEFGHTTGLPHRRDTNGFTLMTPEEIKAFHTDTNDDECRHFRAGPPPLNR
jgi:hypothetical protein